MAMRDKDDHKSHVRERGCKREVTDAGLSIHRERPTKGQRWGARAVLLDQRSVPAHSMVASSLTVGTMVTVPLGAKSLGPCLGSWLGLAQVRNSVRARDGHLPDGMSRNLRQLLPAS